jgi:hypothetical protein
MPGRRRTGCVRSRRPRPERWSGRHTKIGIAVREDLATWQQLNVTAFLASAVAGLDGLLGEKYEDASGTGYLPMFRQPVLVYAASHDALRRVRGRATARGLPVAIYTEELLETDNDEDSRAAVRAVPAEDLRIAGIAVCGRRNVVDKVLQGLRLHP